MLPKFANVIIYYVIVFIYYMLRTSVSRITRSVVTFPRVVDIMCTLEETSSTNDLSPCNTSQSSRIGILKRVGHRTLKYGCSELEGKICDVIYPQRKGRRTEIPRKIRSSIPRANFRPTILRAPDRK